MKTPLKDKLYLSKLEKEMKNGNEKRNKRMKSTNEDDKLRNEKSELEMMFERIRKRSMKIDEDEKNEKSWYVRSQWWWKDWIWLKEDYEK